MLHDLYLLSCYFEPVQAMLIEDELKRRYGEKAIVEAMQKGWLERICAPCVKGGSRVFFRLSERGAMEMNNLPA